MEALAAVRLQGAGHHNIFSGQRSVGSIGSEDAPLAMHLRRYERQHSTALGRRLMGERPNADGRKFNEGKVVEDPDRPDVFMP